MSNKNIWLEYFEAIIVAVILALIIRTFIVQAFVIPSRSMYETLHVGDRLLLKKFSYGVKIPFTDIILFENSGPERGDVVVFPYPLDSSQDYIKRVVAVPGDKVAIKDKELYVNGLRQDAPYVRHEDSNIETGTSGRDQMDTITVPEGKYFVMGDNRDNSADSRFWGFVNGKTIYGKAWLIYWSSEGLDKISWERIGKIIY